MAHPTALGGHYVRELSWGKGAPDVTWGESQRARFALQFVDWSWWFSSLMGFQVLTSCFVSSREEVIKRRLDLTPL